MGKGGKGVKKDVSASPFDRLSPKKKESEIQNEILEWLSFHTNVFVWKANTTGMFDPTRNIYRSLKGHNIRGVSDILGIVRHVVERQSPIGQLLAIEVKRPETRNTVTADQRYFLDRIRVMGGISEVCTSLTEAIELVGPKL